MYDTNDQKNKTKIKITILGDPNVGKSSFVNSYIASSGDNNVVQKPEVKRFEKQIKGNKFILDFYEFNVKSDKIIPFVNSCQVVLVMFDLNNRNSFDSLSDCWLSFLRDDCFYQNEIYILGNYETRNSAPLTQTDEINEMIKFSSLAGNEVGNSLNVNYIEVGNKTKNEMNLLIDELIFNTYEDELKNEKADDGDKGHSFKVEKCVIY